MPNRIAIVSDVHGGLIALDAVLADLEDVRPGVVVHGGDLVGIGPRPAECVDRVRELGWPAIQGNWEHLLEQDAPPAVPADRRAWMQRHVAWMEEKLGPERIAWLAALPLLWRDEDRVAVVHAIPGDVWSVVVEESGDDVLAATFGPLGASVAAYGHTHLPFVRRLDQLTVANSGSVSSPADGDPRASYLVVEDGRVTVRRVAYDVERAVADLEAARALDPDWSAQMYRTARFPA
ncbi:MAG: metallophosphoesterase family protein [Candidatus Dormiibacterota bacterium]